MLSTQQILNEVVNMQANAQAALPVLPNNGNPMGANNMPHTAPPVQQQPAAVQPAMPQQYSWLQPSQSMLNVRQMLEARRGGGVSTPVATPYQRTSTVPEVQPQMPVMPQLMV